MVSSTLSLTYEPNEWQTSDMFVSLPTTDIRRLLFPNRCTFQARLGQNSLGDTTLYLPAFRDERRLSKELVGSIVTIDHGTMQQLLLMA